MLVTKIVLRLVAIVTLATWIVRVEGSMVTGGAVTVCMLSDTVTMGWRTVIVESTVSKLVEPDSIIVIVLVETEEVGTNTVDVAKLV